MRSIYLNLLSIVLGVILVWSFLNKEGFLYVFATVIGFVLIMFGLYKTTKFTQANKTDTDNNTEEN